MPEAILPGSPLTADIPNAAYPTAGLGLVLGTNGLMDPIALGTGTRTGAKFLRDDQTWQVAGSTTYRKTTAKTVNTTVAATDLLNGEITIAAGAMGATGCLRLTAWGDAAQASGVAAAAQRFQLLLGGSTILDSAAGQNISNTATRFTWDVVVDLFNTGVSAQVARMKFQMYLPSGIVAGQTVWATGEGGSYSTGNFSWGIGNGTGAVNTASAQALVLNVINGSASASYETKLIGALVELV